MYSTWLWLTLATMLAIIVRSIPAWTNVAWGNDFGIYYGITNSIIKSQHLFIDYNGWGNSYQFFPVLYLIAALTHVVTGLNLLWLLPKIVPIIGGLTVPMMYFIVLELLKDKKVAFTSALLLAIAPFHVYQTSHAAPLTVGHFFMLLSIYLFVRYMRDWRFILPLILSTMLLVSSHHLTTYFYIISITAVTLVDAAYREKVDKKNLYMLVYVVAAASLAFSYWFFIAKPVFFDFMPAGVHLPPHYIVLLYYTLTFVSFTLVLLKKRWFTGRGFFKNHGLSMTSKMIWSFSAILCGEVIFFSLASIPGLNLRVNLASIPYSIPIIMFISLSVAGFSSLKNSRGGVVVRAWFVVIFSSFLYALLSGGNTNLYPDRHLEYMIVPLCVPAAVTLTRIMERMEMRKVFSHPLVITGSKLVHTKCLLAVVFIVMFMVSNVLVVYPAMDSINAVDERVTQPCINAIYWMKGNVSEKCVVASDHRLSMILWAEGFNITMGKTNLTWTSRSWRVCLPELHELNVSYVLIDDIMRGKVVNVDVGKYYYMNNESYRKFSSEPFELVYRNVTLNAFGEEVHWAEVYRVNWSYICTDLFSRLTG